jgi:mannose-6-phosphate isomerase
LYPLKLENIYFEKIWGGKNFNSFRNNVPKGKIGESWDVCFHKNVISNVKNGVFKGVSLEKLISKYGSKLLGTDIPLNYFPILIKIINAEDNLSVQVHPNSEYARDVENDIGKNEIWYVLDCKKDSEIILGTKNCTKKDFEKALYDGNIDKYLNNINVNKGEVFFVKEGLVHAIGKGVMILEIQQNSDITYRIYDYNRNRELQIEKALQVIDLKNQCKKSLGLKFQEKNYSKTYYCISKNIAVELYHIYKNFQDVSNSERFYIYTCVQGKGYILYSNGKEYIGFGESIFIPASLGMYEFVGNMKLIKSYVPNIDDVNNEILRLVNY